MALESPQAEWLYRFTGGAIALPIGPVRPGEVDLNHDLKTQLEMLNAREWAEEQALKTVLLARAFSVIEKEKETMRANFDLKVETYDDPDAPDMDLLDDTGKATGKTKKKSKVTEQVVRDEKGRQERAYDAMESTRLAKAATGRTNAKLTGIDATKSMAILVGEKDKLVQQQTWRSRIDKKAKPPCIERVEEDLFTDKEVMDELYTPLVRDLVVPETFVPPKFSATQKMIDGSDDYYIKECRTKGEPIPTGVAAFAKGAIDLGSSVADTVLVGLGSAGELSKEAAARARDITMGVAATLSAGVEVVDQIDDLRKTGDFSSAGYQAVLNKLAMGLGKIVAGSTGNMSLGMVITDSITGATALTAIGADIAAWKKKGGPFPLDKMFTLIGSGIAAGLSGASDQTSDTDKDGKDNGKVSTHFAQASQAATTLFNTVGAATKAKLLTQIKAGNWGAVFDFIAQTGVEIGQQLPAQLYLDQHYNEQSDYDKQKVVFASLGSTPEGVGKAGTGLGSLARQAGDAAADKISRKTGQSVPLTPQQKQLLEHKHLQDLAKIEKAFQDKEQALADNVEQIAAIESQMAAEQEAFRRSLSCLGSDQPTDADFKSIAKLIEQLERDRKIWDGLTAIFGGGLGAATGMVTAMTVAAEVVPALKAAGQLVKYCVNLKAAADRCEAWLTWREGQKDAVSAVSPYATSIDNFTKNQGQQFTHYSIQAAANAIQALLACGEMSPLGPAFKAAGGGVAAAAAAEELIYQFYKRQALRNAWKLTQKALDPKNYGNRKMALLVRQINPTLAKFTMAYGALVEESPVAITACNRIGIDREALARSSDKVGELRDYFEKLYPDDGVLVGVLEVTPGKTRLPEPALKSKAWALSMLIWSKEHQLATPNSSAIVAHLSIAETLRATANRSDEQTEQLIESLSSLWSAFASFQAVKSNAEPIKAIQRAVDVYADLAEAQLEAVQMELGAAVPQQVPVLAT